MLEFLGARGMNAYVYAPKDEPKHRREWRTPYDADELRCFRELAAAGAQSGIRVAFAVSPGLDIDYELEGDRAALERKCAAMLDLGISWFLLALDDIPMRPGLAQLQAASATALLEGLRARDPDSQLCCCPTEYLGVQPSSYLSKLDAGLHADIDLLWTGPTVCSPTITADQARAWRSGLGDRGVVLWDNVPVNDGTMESRLHLGPYEGRQPALVEELRGVLCNPMSQPRSSRVMLATAAEFLSSPDDYEPDVAWSRALATADDDSFGALVAACADGPMRSPNLLALHQLVDALDDEIGAPGWVAALDALAGHLRTARRAADELLARAEHGEALAIEVAPWAQCLRDEAAAGLSAAKLLQHCRPVAAVDDAAGIPTGCAKGPDPNSVLADAFALLFTWGAARRSEHVVFGPRFAIYPAIVAVDGMPGTAALDGRAAVVEDANAIDKLCRLALAVADDWRVDDDRAVRVFVDGEQRGIGAQGEFDARGRMVLVRTGRAATRIDPSVALPFRDARFA